MRAFLLTFEKVVDKIVKIIALIGGAVCVFMVAFLCVSVFAQRVLQSPIVGVYEVCQYVIMPMVCLPGFAYAYHMKLLPKFDLLSNNNNVIWQWFCLIVNAVIEIVVFALMTYGAFRFAIIGTQGGVSTYAGSHWFPLYPFYWFSPIGFLALEITVVFTHLVKFYEFITKDKIIVEKTDEEEA